MHIVYPGSFKLVLVILVIPGRKIRHFQGWPLFEAKHFTCVEFIFFVE